MKTVYIVLEGDDCEGAYINAVFAEEEDAILYLDKEYGTWMKASPTERRKTYVWDGKVREGCTSAWIEEWDVE